MAHPVIGTPWQKLDGPVSEQELEGVEKYWRAANYLSVGQIYLRSNPLMRSDWTDEKTGETRDFGRPDVKHRLVVHWGTTPGVNFLFGHVIPPHRRPPAERRVPDELMSDGPPPPRSPCSTPTMTSVGHHQRRGLASEVLRQFSYPGGIPPPRPGDPGLSHEAAELGFTSVPRLRRRHGQPQPCRCCRRGRRTMIETGPLATSWRSASS